jgi:hypothetical protein
MMYIKSVQIMVVTDCPHFYFICLSQRDIKRKDLQWDQIFTMDLFYEYYDTKRNCPVSCSLSQAWRETLKIIIKFIHTLASTYGSHSC